MDFEKAKDNELVNEAQVGLRGQGAVVEGMPNGIGFGSTEFHVLRANKDFLLSKHLYYIVSGEKFRKRYVKFMTGSAGQQRIFTNFLKKLEIPLPPLKIQKQIVEKLSAAQEYPSSRTFGSLRGRQKTTFGAKIEIKGIVRQRIA